MATRLSQYRSVPSAAFEQRAVPRHRVTVTRATLSKRGAKPVDAELHDVSIYGCRFAARTRHEPGDRLWLRFRDSLPVPATLVWNDGAFLGCRFDSPLARSMVRDLTREPF
jgi:hypothetical protein